MVLFAPLARLVLTRFRWFFASGDQRDAEILALRHQVLVLQRQIDRAQFSETDSQNCTNDRSRMIGEITTLLGPGQRATSRRLASRVGGAVGDRFRMVLG